MTETRAERKMQRKWIKEGRKQNKDKIDTKRGAKEERKHKQK